MSSRQIDELCSVIVDALEALTTQTDELHTRHVVQVGTAFDRYFHALQARMQRERELVAKLRAGRHHESET